MVKLDFYIILIYNNFGEIMGKSNQKNKRIKKVIDKPVSTKRLTIAMVFILIILVALIRKNRLDTICRWSRAKRKGFKTADFTENNKP